ncbi:MAG: LysR substrate-binding domain-containing protein [Xanthomonadales bacterium]|jgi:DNA-binding transcriptional LysR family regulator|nr:LysR substrate-binding domain-containing protein [Xanthomonadales bacterium]
MSLDSITLQCFIAVAETGSFTRAAERVARTQSAVSQQIARLEELLGKPLLLRGKALALTAEGEIFLGYARRIFALQHEAMDRFKEPELEGEVRFGLPEDFASVFLSDVLADFVRLHPRILLNVECDLTLNLLERFRQQQFDLVLVKMSRPEDLPNGLDVWTEPLEWVGDEGLVDADRPVPLILSPQPCVYRAGALEALDAAGRSWHLAFSSPSYAGTIAAVKAGMGLTVLPRNMIPPGCATATGKGLPVLTNTHISLLKHSARNPAVDSLEQFVLKQLR